MIRTDALHATRSNSGIIRYCSVCCLTHLFRGERWEKCVHWRCNHFSALQCQSTPISMTTRTVPQEVWRMLMFIILGSATHIPKDLSPEFKTKQGCKVVFLQIQLGKEKRLPPVTSQPSPQLLRQRGSWENSLIHVNSNRRVLSIYSSHTNPSRQFCLNQWGKGYTRWGFAAIVCKW